MRMPAPAPDEDEETLGPAKGAEVQRACAPCEEEQKIQRMCSTCEDEQKVQRLAADEEEETVQRLAAGPGALIQRQAAPEEDEINSLDELGGTPAGKVMAKRKADASTGGDFLDAGAVGSRGQRRP